MLGKMRAIVVLLIYVYANADENYELPVPGCVVVELDTHAECFTYSNGTASPENAQNICAAKDGRLAIIQHEKTWKSLIKKLLYDKTHAVLLGFSQYPYTVQLTPDIDLTNMSAYWQPTGIGTATAVRYIYTSPSQEWVWYISFSRGSTNYLCQYNVTKKHCQIDDIDGLNTVVSTCFDGNTISNNDTLEVTCSPGYYPKSIQTITCKLGIWDKPKCVAGCQPPTAKNHATMMSDKHHFNFGDKIVFVCEDNYYNWQDFSKSHFILTCQNDSTWSDSNARCSLKQFYTTLTINATEITEEKITLKCGLQSTDIKWIHNGRGIVNSSAFTISSQGYLLVNSNAEKIGGFYMCQAKNAENLQIGNQPYNIVGSRECKAHLESSHISKGLFRKGENVILNCPQESDDHQIKWFRNEEEISDNVHQNIIPGGGLLLNGLTWRDNGTYKCQTMYNFKSNNCKYNVTYYLTVMSPAEPICGVKVKNGSNFYQPWFVILQYEDDVAPFCFGALLNEKWIITSAFCVSPLRIKKHFKGVYAQLGSRESKKKYHISLVKIHPNYRKRRNLNDFGLIRLDGDPVEFNDDIQPVCITSEDIGKVHQCENSAGLKGVLTGWSTNVTKKDDHFILNSVEKNLASKNECRIIGVYDFVEDQFCIKSDLNDDVIAETANGDYGSPFVVSHDEKEYLLGIFTGGEKNYHYDYFTSIFHHYDWIQQTID